MCFKITRALREYYRYCDVSAEVERRGRGSSRPELAWAHRQKHESDNTVADHNSGLMGVIGDCEKRFRYR